MLGKLLFFASPLLRFLGGCDACQGQDTGGKGKRVKDVVMAGSKMSLTFGSRPCWCFHCFVSSIHRYCVSPLFFDLFCRSDMAVLFFSSGESTSRVWENDLLCRCFVSLEVATPARAKTQEARANA